MATYDDLTMALVRADKAGDTASANLIAAAMKKAKNSNVPYRYDEDIPFEAKPATLKKNKALTYMEKIEKDKIYKNAIELQKKGYDQSKAFKELGYGSDDSKLARFGYGLSKFLGQADKTAGKLLGGKTLGELEWSKDDAGNPIERTWLEEFGDDYMSLGDARIKEAEWREDAWKKREAELSGKKKEDIWNISGGIGESTSYMGGGAYMGAGKTILGTIGRGVLGDAVIGSAQHGSSDEPIENTAKEIAIGAAFGLGGQLLETGAKKIYKNFKGHDTPTVKIDKSANPIIEEGDVKIAQDILSKMKEDKRVIEDAPKTPLVEEIPTPEIKQPTQGISKRAIALESGGDYYALNPKTGAYGKYQFMPKTLKEYADKVGISVKEAKTPSGQEALYEVFAADQKRGLEARGIEVNEFNTYMAHQQGVAGWSRILKNNLTPEIIRNMKANLPKSARKTGDIRGDFIEYWKGKFEDGTKDMEMRSNASTDITPPKRDLIEEAKATADEQKINSKLDDIFKDLEKEDIKIISEVDPQELSPTTKLYREIKEAGVEDPKAYIQLIQERAKKIYGDTIESTDDLLRAKPLEVGKIDTPQNFEQSVGKSYSDMSFKDLSQHPLYENLLKDRESISAQTANRLTDPALSNRGGGQWTDKNGAWEYEVSRPLSAKTIGKNYAGDFVLTKRDVAKIRSGKITPEITQKIRDDLGRLDYDPAYRQTIKGKIDFSKDKAVITIFRDADATTIPHELGHYFRRTLDDVEIKEAEQAFGVKDGVWDMAAEERFANGFTKYLSTGDAPTPGLKAVFEKFKVWIRKTWEDIFADADKDFKLKDDQKLFFKAILGDKQAAKKLFGFDKTNPNIFFQAQKLENDFISNGRVDLEAIKKYATDLPIPLKSVDDLKGKLEFKNGGYYIKTPIQDIKINPQSAYRHFEINTHGQSREALSGGFIETFKDPLFVAKDVYKGEDITVFYKPFQDISGDVNLKYIKDNNGNIHLAGYGINKNGELINTTFFDISPNKVKKLIEVKDEDLLYYNRASANHNVANSADNKILHQTDLKENKLFQAQKNDINIQINDIDKKISQLKDDGISTLTKRIGELEQIKKPSPAQKRALANNRMRLEVAEEKAGIKTLRETRAKLTGEKLHEDTTKAKGIFAGVKNTIEKIKNSDTYNATISLHRLQHNHKDYLLEKEALQASLNKERMYLEELHYGLMEFSGDARTSLYRHMTGEDVSLPKELTEFAGAMREEISTLGQKLVDEGILTPETYATWKDTYLHRTYEKHINKSTIKRIYDESITIDKIFERGKKKVFNESELGDIKEYMYAAGYDQMKLDHASTFDDLIAMASEKSIADGGVELKRLPNGSVKARVDYTKAERIAMGEIEDIALALPETLMKLQTMVAHSKFLRSLPENIIGDTAKYTPVELEAAGYKKLSGVKYGALNGKYVTKDVAKDIDYVHRQFYGDERGILKAYDKTLSLWKKSKTIYMPTAHLNNFVGNFSLQFGAGANPITSIKNVTQGAIAASKITHFKKLKSKNHLSRLTSAEAKEYNKMLKDTNLMLYYDLEAHGLFGRSGINDILMRNYNADAPIDTKGFLRGVDQKVTKIYGAEDDIHRFALAKHFIENEKLTIEEAMLEVSKNIPDYTASMTTMGDWLRRSGLAPFWSWSYHATPIMLRQIRERPARAGFVLGAISLLYLGNDINPLDEGDTPKGFSFRRVPISRDGDKVTTLKIDKLLPQADLFNWLPGTNEKNALIPENVRTLLIGGYPQSLAGWANNESLYFGTPLTRDDGAFGTYQKNIKYPLQSIAPIPGVISNLWNLIESKMFSKEKRRSNETIDPRETYQELLKIMGINTMTYNINKLEKKAKDKK